MAVRVVFARRDIAASKGIVLIADLIVRVKPVVMTGAGGPAEVASTTKSAPTREPACVFRIVLASSAVWMVAAAVAETAR